MKNYYLALILLLFCQAIFSQEKSSFTLSGTITSNNETLENTHIINKRTLKGTITNKLGLFEIPVSIGDTLFISHINFENKEVIISIAEKITKKAAINLISKTHSLEEVTLKKRRSIFYTDPQIMPQAIANATTLKLPYANVISKKDESVAKLSLTSAKVNLDNLINLINGNAKKAKELKKEKLKDKRLNEIRKEYTDFFFTKQLNIDKDYIVHFLNYCLNSGIIIQYKLGNKINLTQLLITESKSFPHRQIDPNTLLTKY